MYRSFRVLSLAISAPALVFASSSHADLVIGSINIAEVIDFESSKTDVNVGAYVGSGFAPSPVAGQLDSDSWAIENNGSGPGSDMDFGETRTAGSGDVEFARGYASGAVSDGGIYSFDTDNNGSVSSHALGIQPTTSMSVFNPGTVILRVLNSTGSTIGSWDIDYDVSVFNDADRSNTVDFAFSTDDITYTTVGSLLLTTDEAADPTPSWKTEMRSTQIATSVADGGNLFLRWTIAFPGGGSGSAFDQLALDNISVAAVPEPGAVLFGGLVCGVVGLAAIARKLRKAFRTVLCANKPV
jgi:hypothetical protein